MSGFFGNRETAVDIAATLKAFAAGLANGVDKPISNMWQQLNLHANRTNQAPYLAFGTITDATPITHTYRVQFEGDTAIRMATYCPRTTHAAGGVRELTTLQPGTNIIGVVHPRNADAFILVTIPPTHVSPGESVLSVISQMTRQRADPAHELPLALCAAGNGILDTSAHRPVDGTLSGEAGWITDTGLRIWLDSFMAQLGVDEFCGVTAYFHDQLLRLAGHNLQLWSAASERESFDDEGECSDWTGFAPYYWEQLGLFIPGTPSVRQNNIEQWMLTHPEEGRFEPYLEGQMSWHRTRHFQGYLGQGGKRIVQIAPIQRSEAAAQYAVGSDPLTAPQYPGLFDETIGLNGHYSLQSAHGISITKRTAIVSPSRRRRPEQKTTGDDATNYKAAGQFGAGPEHKITGDIEKSGPDPAMNSVLGIWDLHAYLFNYANVQPFACHSRDYDTPDEADLAHTDGTSVYVPFFAQLINSPLLSPEPHNRELPVDHRYGNQKFSGLQSGLEFLPDGGVVLYDGFGGEIRMAGGDVFISAPGNVWLQPGKNLIGWAGRDAVIRAQHSVDITATKNDVRIKAENNMQVLAGNSGIGGILLESRASGPILDFDKPGEETRSSGILLKAPNSYVANWASQVYLRTGGGAGEGAVKEGPITIDAAKGQQIITTYAKDFISFTSDNFLMHFGMASGIRPSNSNVFGAQNTLISTPLEADGDIAAVGSVYCRDNLIAATGSVAAANGPFVGDISDASKLLEAFQKIHTLAVSTIPDKGADFFQKLFTDILYSDSGSSNGAGPGNDDLISKAQVSLRVLKDYRTEEFRLYEARWQQMARLTSQSLAKWEEKSVKWQGQDTYPFPGKERFEDSSLFQQDPTIFKFNGPAGKPRPRNSASGEAFNLAGEYAEPQYGTPTPTSLQDYMVLSNY